MLGAEPLQARSAHSDGRGPLPPVVLPRPGEAQALLVVCCDFVITRVKAVLLGPTRHCSGEETRSASPTRVEWSATSGIQRAKAPARRPGTGWSAGAAYELLKSLTMVSGTG